ncbi:E motif [Dillenia turbinata]|uniref:E motif n=1 Tax=Dillenia turbinata TaxID=194707 RepID=A0AAN8W9T3_9MAGN
MRRGLLSNLFNSCYNAQSLAQLHSQLLKTGLCNESFFATKLNSYYLTYTSIDTARKLFVETPPRSVSLWNSLLRSYCRDKQYEKTLRLFRDMFSSIDFSGDKPNNFTICIALKACSRLCLLESGKIIHGFVKKVSKFGSDPFVGAALIELYSKCGGMGDALMVFNEFSLPDVVLWTSVITGYQQNGNHEEALAFFSQMVIMERIEPDPVTLVSVVSACAQFKKVKLGRSAHGFVIRRGHEYGLSLFNSLLNMYSKTGHVRNAANLFRIMPEKDVISWSCMIASYANNGAAAEALELFHEMIAKKFEPNKVTLVGVLQACSSNCNLEEGRKVHKLAAQRGIELVPPVSTALIDMYMKCSAPHEAVDLFRRVPEKDVVSWAALISGYTENGMADKSVEMFCTMLSNEIQPDAIAMVKVLAACSEMGVLQQAFCFHGYVITSGFLDNVYIGASLIEVYSKCANLAMSVKIFKGLVHKDVVIWTSMIASYGIHGYGEDALKVFNQMVHCAAVKPNNTTFLSILSACSHAGLVKEGVEIFDKMVNEYRLMPSSKHYGIVVDLLGRSGDLYKAMDIINLMPFPAGPDVWGALLGACRIHNNRELGEVAAKKLFRIDPNRAGYYILLSNIYALEEKWDGVAKLRALVKQKKMKKMLGESCLEVGNELHSFLAGERYHPQSQQIHNLLGDLEMIMREEAYSPDSDILLQDTEVMSACASDIVKMLYFESKYHVSLIALSTVKSAIS